MAGAEQFAHFANESTKSVKGSDPWASRPEPDISEPMRLKEQFYTADKNQNNRRAG
jgi:hypothetical protein